MLYNHMGPAMAPAMFPAPPYSHITYSPYKLLFPSPALSPASSSSQIPLHFSSLCLSVLTVPQLIPPLLTWYVAALPIHVPL